MQYYLVFCVLASLLCPGQLASFTYDGTMGYLSDREPDNVVRGMKSSCVDIPYNLTLCRGLQYTQMRMPNLLDHDTLSEVIQQAKSWVSLVQIHCHPDTQVFLCSLFSPVCLDRTIKPCRSLCENVKAGCESKMQYYGYNWPDMVRCDKFPEGDLCLKPEHDVTNTTQNICEACNQPLTFEGIIDNNCRAQYVAKVRIRKIKTKKGSKILTLKKSKFYKPGGLTKRERKKLRLVLENGAHCECSSINTTRKDWYLVMGNMTDTNVITVSFISRWKKKSDLRRAIKRIKGDFDCSKIPDILPGGITPPPIPNNKGRGGGKRRGGKNKRNKNKRKGRKKNRRRKDKRGKGRGRKRQNTSQPTETNTSG